MVRGTKALGNIEREFIEAGRAVGRSYMKVLIAASNLRTT